MARKKRMGKMVLWIILALIIIIAAVIVVRTLVYPFGKTVTTEQQPPYFDPGERAVQRLAGGIAIPTVSVQDMDSTNSAPFAEFGRYLLTSYPTVIANTEHETVTTYGHIFRWPGSDPSLDPILFLSHYDVVPPGDDEDYIATEPVYRYTDSEAGLLQEYSEGWEYPAFSGAVANGRIYGRGTLDMKNMLFSIMEAAEQLMEEGFRPQRDIWFAFGQDEEIGGLQGAIHIADHFREKGLRFDAVYDEGGIINMSTPGAEGKPIALVGTGEKGMLTMRIKVAGMGGHSSMPSRKGSLAQAAEIMNKLNTDQMPARFIAPTASFLDNISGERSFAQRAIIANRWLFGPVLLKVLAGVPASNALVRTTTAITMARGSDAANVLSPVSEITVNFRLLPGDTIDDVVAHVERICEGYDTQIELVQTREASGISPTDTRGFRIIGEVLSEVYPGTTLTSYITIGGTDAYKYQIVSDNIYRFMPVALNTYEQNVIHNDNEHISFSNYGRMIRYFRELMRRYDQ